MRWDRHGALAAVDRCVKDGVDDRVWCFLEYSSGEFFIRSD